MLKLNIKRTIFIFICAELMLLYWANMELKEARRQEVVAHKTRSDVTTKEHADQTSRRPPSKQEL